MHSVIIAIGSSHWSDPTCQTHWCFDENHGDGYDDNNDGADDTDNIEGGNAFQGTCSKSSKRSIKLCECSESIKFLFACYCFCLFLLVLFIIVHLLVRFFLSSVLVSLSVVLIFLHLLICKE